MVLLSQQDVEGLADTAAYVEAVHDAFRQRGKGATASSPIALPMDTTQERPDEELSSYLTDYVAALPDQGIIGSYTYTIEDAVAGGNRWYLAVLFDVDTAQPVAFVDGTTWMTEKTGAQAAVGTDALAREDATTLGLIGTGEVARGSLVMTDTVRDFETIRVYSRTPEHREAFAADVDAELGPDVTAVESSAAAVADADVVLTATTSPEPVFDGENLAPGAHVSAMGQSGRGHEVDATTLRRADKYVPDHFARTRASSLQERAKAAAAFLTAFDDGVVNDNYVYAELGDVVAGRVPGRESADEITVFDSTGTGIETIACANLLYERAIEADRGTRFPLGEYVQGSR